LRKRERAKSHPARQSLKQQAKYPKARFSTIVKKAAKIKARSGKRERNDKARIYGPETFVTFLHQHPCIGCGRPINVQQAHRFSGGMGRKAGWQDTIPLCGPRPLDSGLYCGCHASYDAAKASWSREHNLPARSAWFWSNWRFYCGKLGLNPQTGKVEISGRGGAE
jgi:hypothetical protein